MIGRLAHPVLLTLVQMTTGSIFNQQASSVSLYGLMLLLRIPALCQISLILHSTKRAVGISGTANDDRPKEGVLEELLNNERGSTGDQKFFCMDL